MSQQAGTQKERYICIHGHFYQPPRENAWIETVELQDSAYPYHDWNERISAQCYGPNGACRMLDGEGRIRDIVNNYAKISFDFGPTLLAWMQDRTPDAYRRVVDGDKASRERYSGHGSAMAQAYNHLIMPLANRRDKYTQIRWGISDFQHRFGRDPEGMWLPETAVDMETLDIMAELGIRFTVLAPYQAHQVRRVGTEQWQDVTGGRIDPTMGYRQNLPSGRQIALFFYDGPISRAIAFEDLLNNGEFLAKRLAGAFSDSRDWPQLVHIATDGETYGHHRFHGDMALAYALYFTEANNLAKLTNYGEYLEKHPPTHEVQIYENTSWSCGHGVERWRSNCGDNSGMHPGWNQEWRAPLRQALDALRDEVAPQFEQEASKFLKDPWAARDNYIEVILNRAPDNVDRFLADQCNQEANEDEKVVILKLLELQRHAMLMYTSCGWFFDELSGIETVQIMQYAGRVLQLAQETFGDQAEEVFLQKLAEARSNIPEMGNGADIYRRFVKPAIAGLSKMAAHYAIDSLFEAPPEHGRVYSFFVDRMDYRTLQVGASRAAVGRVRIISEITHEQAVFYFGVLHLMDQNLVCGVRGYQGDDVYRALVDDLWEMFNQANFALGIQRLNAEFGSLTYSLRSLFRDEQRRIVNIILKHALEEADMVDRQIFEHHGSFMHFLVDINTPAPEHLRAAATHTLSDDLNRAFDAEPLDTARIQAILNEAHDLGIELDRAGAGYSLERRLDQMAERFRRHPEDISLLKRIDGKVSLAHTQYFDVDLWKVQNVYFELLQSVYPDRAKAGEQGDQSVREWSQAFLDLGNKLGIRTQSPEQNP